MDLIADYSDSEGEGQEEEAKGKLPMGPAPKAPALLPPPNFEDVPESYRYSSPKGDEGPSFGGSPSSSKRPLVQAQGMRPSQGPAKAHRASPAQHGPKGGAKAAAGKVLLPPQLRGR